MNIPYQIFNVGHIDLDNSVLVWSSHITDEFFWEFLQPEELLENMFGLTVINLFLAKGGGLQIIDIPNPVPRFHDIRVWAYHAEPKMLTWIILQLK